MGLYSKNYSGKCEKILRKGPPFITRQEGMGGNRKVKDEESNRIDVEVSEKTYLKCK